MYGWVGWVKLFLAAILLAGLAGAAVSADYQAGPEGCRSYLPQLVAGDRLSLRAGIYRQGLVLHDISGVPGRPILIEVLSQGAGSEERTVIYGNLFWHNSSESLFQGEGNLALYNNIFITHGPAAIRIQPHNGVPHDLQIVHNTVLASGIGMFLRTPENNAFSQIVEGNSVFSPRPISGADTQGNVILDIDSAGRVLVHPFVDPGHMDLSPRHNLGILNLSGHARHRSLPDFKLDFFGRPRSLSDFGIVGCKSTATANISLASCPMEQPCGCESGKKLARRGRFSLSATKVRQAPRLDDEVGAIGQSGAAPLSVWLSQAGFGVENL